VLVVGDSPAGRSREASVKGHQNPDTPRSCVSLGFRQGAGALQGGDRLPPPEFSYRQATKCVRPSPTGWPWSRKSVCGTKDLENEPCWIRTNAPLLKAAYCKGGLKTTRIPMTDNSFLTASEAWTISSCGLCPIGRQLRRGFTVTDNGVVVIPKGHLFGAA